MGRASAATRPATSNWHGPLCGWVTPGVTSNWRGPVWAASAVLTWAGTRGRPRVYVPYAALAVIVSLLVVAGRLAG